MKGMVRADFYNGDRQPLILENIIDLAKSSFTKAVSICGVKKDLSKKIKIGPNAPCPCERGKKYKKWCGETRRKSKVFK